MYGARRALSMFGRPKRDLANRSGLSRRRRPPVWPSRSLMGHTKPPITNPVANANGCTRIVHISMYAVYAVFATRLRTAHMLINMFRLFHAVNELSNDKGFEFDLVMNTFVVVKMEWWN